MTYAQKLRDPRWQKRRLETLQLAEWKCEQCLVADKTLHVHHKRYRRGAEPWEYEDHELAVLCESCHDSVTQTHENLKDAMCLMDSEKLDRLLGFAEGLLLSDGDIANTTFRNWQQMDGICAAASYTAFDTSEDMMEFFDSENQLQTQGFHDFVDKIVQRKVKPVLG